jgi:hypothetical protein
MDRKTLNAKDAEERSAKYAKKYLLCVFCFFATFAFKSLLLFPDSQSKIVVILLPRSGIVPVADGEGFGRRQSPALPTPRIPEAPTSG